ncbi:Acyl transferase [Actinobacteria bacterium OK074]|nr:Acyl transferase [Actinobacteria bacterium OK074]
MSSRPTNSTADTTEAADTTGASGATGAERTVRERSGHLFPGQGDFSVGALTRALGADRSGVLRAAVREVFAEVDAVAVERELPPLGPWLLGPAPPTGRDLAQAPTGTPQLALYGVSLAVHRALVRSRGAPRVLVGVSFGEIAALTAAGAFTVSGGARVAHDLARVLVTSCPGGLTLLSCPEATAHGLFRAASAPEAVVGVVNDDRSVVAAGPLAALTRVEKTAADAGITAVRLHLPFASHHPALHAPAQEFAAAVRPYGQRKLAVPVHSAVAGRAYTDADDLAARLADCLTRPARVPDALRRAAGHGDGRVGALFEAGTGAALASGARATLPGTTVHAPLAEPGFPW